jgi:hypothetical protein
VTPSDRATPPGGPPAPLLAALVLVGLEALALVVEGGYELAVLSTSRATMGVTTALFFVVYGAGLGACAWQLHRLRSWARAPVVLAQLIQLPVAWSFRGGSTTLVAVLLAAVAVLVLAGIFHPASIAALDAADRVDSGDVDSGDVDSGDVGSGG